MTQTMLCAVFLDADNIEIQQRPIPICPEGGMLVKIHSCGICGGDARNYHTELKGGVRNQIMGHEIAGEVVEVCKSVTRFQPGDRVALAPDVSCGSCWYCKHGLVNLCQNHRMIGTDFPGGFAQYISLPQVILEHGFVEHIPANIPYDYAAFAETVSAVVACQHRLSVSMGNRILIIGDGPVGCLHAEVARARGASKVMLAGMDKLSFAEQFSLDRLLDNHDPQSVYHIVMTETDGIGVDVAICAIPSVRPQQQALELVRKRGTVVIYGGVPKNSEMVSLNSNLIHYNEINVTGSFSYPITGLYDALAAIAAGQIHPEKFITHRICLSELVQGMRMIDRGEALKVIINPWLEA